MSNKDRYQALLNDKRYMVTKEGEVYARLPARGRPAKNRTYPYRRVDFVQRQSGQPVVKYQQVNLTLARVVWQAFNGPIEDWQQVASSEAGSCSLSVLTLMTKNQKRWGEVGKLRGEYSEGDRGDRLYDGKWMRALNKDIACRRMTDERIAEVYGLNSADTVEIMRTERFGNYGHVSVANMTPDPENVNSITRDAETLENHLEVTMSDDSEYNWIAGGELTRELWDWRGQGSLEDDEGNHRDE